eukprot:GHVU01194562.1.p3 GENE.GHVU01194562.1~~GHVU01194562.1.p3  ORF type:complete len:119 (-),score=11.36 GHVU01194562.1:286-642(-)
MDARCGVSPRNLQVRSRRLHEAGPRRRHAHTHTYTGQLKRDYESNRQMIEKRGTDKKYEGQRHLQTERKRGESDTTDTHSVYIEHAHEKILPVSTATCEHATDEAAPGVQVPVFAYIC